MPPALRSALLVAASLALVSAAASPVQATPSAPSAPSSAFPHSAPPPDSGRPWTEKPGKGCPKSAPKGTLREGSRKMGVYNLCVESVLASPSREAALAVRYALKNLGVPYVTSNETAMEERDKEGFFDCSSYVSRAYEAAGVPTRAEYGRSPNTTELRDSVTWVIRVSASSAQPGDIAVFATETGQHAVMILPRGFIAHTNNFGDVSHVTKASRYPQLGSEYATYLRVVG